MTPRIGDGGAIAAAGASWLEASARGRIAGLLDPGSFKETIGPEARETSPHLASFELPVAFDDGTIVGRGTLRGRAVLVAAQEGRFMGGTFGEVSAAKITGLVRAARDAAARDPAPDPVPAVLLALDTGGVRLQEANAGELGVSEIVRAIVEARAAGVAIVALVGGRAGAFGGGGIVAASCGAIVISQFGRTSVTGPEVIETNRGVEEFDSKDRPLVWRITGGRTRRLIGGADRYVEDRIEAFRDAAIRSLADIAGRTLDLGAMGREQSRLADRLARFGDCRDAPEIWAAMEADGTLPRAGARDIADLPDRDFITLVPEVPHGAR